MDRAGARHGNLTPPRISPSCPHCLIPVSPGAVAGQEYHYQIADEGRTGSKPAAMRNSPPQAALWTDGHRSAPFLAVFDAVSRTGGLGASSSVASALLPEGLSSADVSRCRIFYLQGSGRKSVGHRYSQYRANWARILFMIWSSSPSKAVFSFWRSISCSGDNIRFSRWNHSGR